MEVMIKHFIFIDPYGYKDIRGSDIKGLIKNKKNQCFLFLNSTLSVHDTKGTPEALIEFIDR